MGFWVFGLLAAIPAMNIALDPLGYARVVGWRPARPSAVDLQLESLGRWPVPHGVREAKMLNVAHYRPASVVFGSSTVWSYVDVAYPPLRSGDGRPGYNFGLAGASFRELSTAFEHVVALTPPKQVVFGTEFYMFAGDKPSAPGFSDLPMAHHPSFQWERARFVATRLLSADYTSASLSAVFDGVSQWIEFWFGRVVHAAESGAAPAGPPARDAFLGLISNAERIQIAALYPPGPQPFRFADDDGWSSLEAFRRVVEISRAHGIDLRFYISPNHARTFELIRMMGFWPQYESWERQLVAILDNDARMHADRPPIPLWDFSGYTSVTTEPVMDDATPVDGFRHFADSFHFKSDVGLRMMDRIFKSDELQSSPADFGIQLTPANIERHLDDMNRGHEAYRAAHMEEVRGMAAMLRSLGRLDPANAP